MKTSLFEYSDYKQYLADRLPIKGAQRGTRAKLAAALKCQGAFISQVLKGRTHFSLEHAVLIDEFLSHSSDESAYFMLLVHYGRAGSQKLEMYYWRQIEEVRKKRQVVSERIKVGQTLSQENQMTYYGDWYYAAIHILLLIHDLRKKEELANHLHLPISLVSEVLDFLQSSGFITEKKGEYKVTTQRIHLGTDSKMLSKHHINWRLRAIQALERRFESNLHYSGPIAISRKNAERIRNILLSTIETLEPIIAEPNEEAGYCICMDFFRV